MMEMNINIVGEKRGNTLLYNSFEFFSFFIIVTIIYFVISKKFLNGDSMYIDKIRTVLYHEISIARMTIFAIFQAYGSVLGDWMTTEADLHKTSVSVI